MGFHPAHRHGVLENAALPVRIMSMWTIIQKTAARVRRTAQVSASLPMAIVDSAVTSRLEFAAMAVKAFRALHDLLPVHQVVTSTLVCSRCRSSPSIQHGSLRAASVPDWSDRLQMILSTPKSWA